MVNFREFISQKFNRLRKKSAEKERSFVSDVKKGHNLETRSWGRSKNAGALLRFRYALFGSYQNNI